MNTKELTKTVAERVDMTQKETYSLLKRTVKIFNDNLGKGIGFLIPQLGTFTTHIRDRRKSYLPALDKYAILPKKRVVHFQPSVVLKEDVKELEVEDNV